MARASSGAPPEGRITAGAAHGHGRSNRQNPDPFHVPGRGDRDNVVFRIYRLVESYLDNFENYGSLLCRNIAFASSDYLFTGAYPSLNFVVEEFFDSEDLDGLSIVNNARV